jgi:protein-disulfide isomerase
MSPLKTSVGEDDHRRGDVNAPCVLVEYGDYECPHCRAALPLVHRIERHFGARLCFVFRNFPMTQMHFNAEAAAEATEFAASQDTTQAKYWEMHDLLFRNQERLGLDLYLELASQLGLDQEALHDALQSGAFQKRVRADFAGGVRSGVNGTPTFFINGERFNGPRDFEHVVAAIDAAIAAHDQAQ